MQAAAVRLQHGACAMSFHYTKDTTSAPSWCGRCDRVTEHFVSDGRLGHCLEHISQKHTKAQLKAIKKKKEDEDNPKLF